MESWVRCGHFEPKGGGPTYTKKWCNNFYNGVAVECTLYLARPLKEEEKGKDEEYKKEDYDDQEEMEGKSR